MVVQLFAMVLETRLVERYCLLGSTELEPAQLLAGADSSIDSLLQISQGRRQLDPYT